MRTAKITGSVALELFEWGNLNSNKFGASAGYGGSHSGWWYRDEYGAHRDAESLIDAVFSARKAAG